MSLHLSGCPYQSYIIRFDVWQRTRSVAMLLTGKARAEHGAQQPCLHERNPVSTRPCPSSPTPGTIIPSNPKQQSRFHPATSCSSKLSSKTKPSSSLVCSSEETRDLEASYRESFNEVYFDHRKWVIGSGAHDQLVQDFSLEKVVKVRELIIRTNKRWEPRLSSRTTPGETREEKQQWVRQSGLLRVR
jgi:hypothetical protein